MTPHSKEQTKRGKCDKFPLLMIFPNQYQRGSWPDKILTHLFAVKLQILADCRSVNKPLLSGIPLFRITVGFKSWALLVCKFSIFKQAVELNSDSLTWSP